jgi:hypothetical protein
MKLRVACVVVGLLSLVLPLTAQSVGSRPASAPVPPFIQFSSVATDVNGKPLAGVEGVTFYLYRDQQGGSPLWMETQNVQPDPSGHYTVLLGSMTSYGLPASIFASGEAHWLGVQVQGQAEEPRVLLVSAPYALKAADADTVGGLPPSAFVLAAPPAASQTVATSIAGTAVVGSARRLAAASCDLTSDGKAGVNALAKFTTPCNVEASAISESGGNVGIGVAPASDIKLYVSDTKSNFGTAWSQRNVFASSATSNGANDGLAFDLDASNMTIPGGITDNGYRLAIRGLAYAGTTNFAGTLGSQFGVLAEAGISQGRSGAKVGAAYGGDFTIVNNVPGTTISNAYGVYISNSGTAGTITNRYDLYASSANAKNYFAGNVGIGTSSPTAQLEVNGTVAFTGNQTVNGNLSSTGTVSGSSFQIGSNLFAYGSYANTSAFLGFAGNPNSTSFGNTATGYQALHSVTSGGANTASGYQALYSATSGGANTASGYQALYSDTSGESTAYGYQTLFSNTTGDHNVAVGAGALYANTIGSYNIAFGDDALSANTTGTYNVAIDGLSFNTTGSDNTSVGFTLYSNTTGSQNTAVGKFALDANMTGSYNTAIGYSALSSIGCDKTYQTAIGYYAGYLSSGLDQCGVGNYQTFVGANTKPGSFTLNNITAIGASAEVAGNNATAIGANAEVTTDNSLVLGSINGVNGATANTNVGIGTTAPSNVFTIAQGAGHAISDSWDVYSSRRWKTNIQTLHNALDMVERLRGVSYDRRDTGKHEVGVIAEEVGAVLPEVVSYEENGRDARGVDYSRLTALLIEATKEQQRELRQEQTELAKALRQIKQQQSLLRTQASAMQSLVAEVRKTRETLRKAKEPVAAAQPALVATK